MFNHFTELKPNFFTWAHFPQYDAAPSALARQGQAPVVQPLWKHTVFVVETQADTWSPETAAS